MLSSLPLYLIDYEFYSFKYLKFIKVNEINTFIILVLKKVINFYFYF